MTPNLCRMSLVLMISCSSAVSFRELGRLCLSQSRYAKNNNFRCNVWWPAAPSVSPKKIAFPSSSLTASLHQFPSLAPSHFRSCDCIWGKVEQGQGKASSSEAVAAGRLDSKGHKTHRPWHIAGSLHTGVATPSMHYYTGWTQCCKTEHRFMLSQRRGVCLCAMTM